MSFTQRFQPKVTYLVMGTLKSLAVVNQWKHTMEDTSNLIDFKKKKKAKKEWVSQCHSLGCTMMTKLF